MSLPTPPYTKRRRQPGEAMPGTIDVMHSEVYSPAKHNPPQPTRPGAMDAFSKPSKGLRT